MIKMLLVALLSTPIILIITLFCFLYSPQGLGPTPPKFLPDDFFKKPGASLHELKLFDGGAAAFSEILERIDGTKDSLYLQIFIFKADEIGLKVAGAMINAANSGVNVTINKDVVGTFFELPELMKGKPSPVYTDKSLNDHSNIDVYTKIFRRTDHSKYYIFDNRTVIFGGMNIADNYHKKWHDYMVEIDDQQLASAFYETVVGGKTWPDNAPFVIASNNRQTTPILRGMIETFRNAKEKIRLLHAYVSDSKILDALSDAVGRGVDLELIIPKVTDTHLNGNKATINRLLALKGPGKVEILLYPKMAHSKAAIIDDEIVVIGSANLTHRSMRRSGEVVAFAHGATDSQFINDLSKSFDTVKEISDPVETPFFLTLKEKLAAIFDKYTW